MIKAIAMTKTIEEAGRKPMLSPQTHGVMVVREITT